MCDNLPYFGLSGVSDGKSEVVSCVGKERDCFSS